MQIRREQELECLVQNVQFMDRVIELQLLKRHQTERVSRESLENVALPK